MKTPETSEIGVRRAELAAVLDGHRSKMGIGRQVPGAPCFPQQITKNRPVLFSGMKDSNNRLTQPSLDDGNGLVGGKWLRKDSPIRRYPQKSKQDNPGQRDRFLAIQRRLKP